MPSNFISLDKAKQMTTAFRGKKEKILEPSFKGKGVLPICETFPRAPFDTVLAKDGCVGLRFYFAMDETNLVKLVIVGVNEKNEDMLATADSSTTMSATTMTSRSGTETEPETPEDDRDIFDDGVRCPDLCPPPSPLNS